MGSYGCVEQYNKTTWNALFVAESLLYWWRWWQWKYLNWELPLIGTYSKAGMLRAWLSGLLFLWSAHFQVGVFGNSSIQYRNHFNPGIVAFSWKWTAKVGLGFPTAQGWSTNSASSTNFPNLLKLGDDHGVVQVLLCIRAYQGKGDHVAKIHRRGTADRQMFKTCCIV